VGASQPSARSCSARGSVVRAAICIGCGLASLTSPTLAQVPKPTTGFRSEPIQPWQPGKPAEFRQPRPDAGTGQEAPWNAARQELLSLLQEEKRLLVDYGSDHPDVCSVRERIQIIREQLAQHPPVQPPPAPAPLPPISVQTPYREVPSTTASTSSLPGRTPPLPLPPVRSQFLQPAGTEDGTAAKDRCNNTQTMTSSSRMELIRPANFSTAGNPSPAVVKTDDKDTHPAAIDSTKPSAQAVVSSPRSVADNSASQPLQDHPRANSFFETGFGQLIGIVGAVLLGVLIHLIALVVILRRYSARLAQLSRVEPASVGFVGQEAAAGAQTVAAIAATSEAPLSSTAESFDIGPTYAEEMQQKQQAQNQQEEAMLRHIFELNLQMREQLRQPSGGAA
jgi:hypothetical protein